MRIALIGYGKMGKAIETIAVERGHIIAVKIQEENKEDINALAAVAVDVAIEFTSPDSAVDNILKCFRQQIPVVCGTTGWYADYATVESACISNQVGLIAATNFSIGVNIFFALNQKLAALMSRHSAYEVSVEEIHHTQKLDAPSGTAISLANDIIHAHPSKNQWTLNTASTPSDLVITAKRIDPAPGTHTVRYQSPIDDIEIIHTAHNRTGFATGAVLAAEFLQGKSGIFTMKDVLGID